MRTFHSLKGLPVFAKNDGKILGEVCDLLISDEGRVNGLLMEPKGLFHRQRFIPIEDVSSLGHDGVMLDDASLNVARQEDGRYLFHSHHGLHGKTLLSTEGEKLGLLEDVYFQENMGTIVGYEVTDGFFSDMTEGKKIVKTTCGITVGKDAIIVEMKE